MNDSILIDFINYFKKDIEYALSNQYFHGDNIIADRLFYKFGEYGLRKILEELNKCQHIEK